MKFLLKIINREFRKSLNEKLKETKKGAKRKEGKS